MTHLKLQKLQKGDYPPAHRLSVNVLVEFYLYPTVGTVLIHSIKPELTE